MLRIILFLFLICNITLITNAQSNKPSQTAKKGPEIDQKKLAKANEYIAKAIKETNKEKQSDMITNAVELFKEMKMSKEGAIIIGDAFFNAGDNKTATKWYGKGDKTDKKESYKKVGESMLEETFKIEDPKEQNKALAKALQVLTKSVGAQEANRLIGNAFYDMGESQYPRAIDYYLKANNKEGVFMIADLYAAGPDKDLAASTYAKVGTKDAFRKAGDLYFNKGDYTKAVEFYAQGGVMDGFLKYANELKKAGKTEMANVVYGVVADSFIKQGKPEDVTQFAVQAEKDMNYELASSLYYKLNQKNLAKKYAAYVAMKDMNFMKAKDTFESIGNTDICNEINLNVQALTNLQQNFLVLNEIRANVPKVGLVEDPTTKKLEYDKRDIVLRDQYYNNPVNIKNISDAITKVSLDYQKLKGSQDLKQMVRQSFMQFNPIKNVLDVNTFARKVAPAQVTPSMVVF
jgi:mannose/fructose-specific phosphotransferase system component IIA